MAAAVALATTQVRAAQSPSGCNANNFTVNISKNHNNIVNGTVVTYTITAENPLAGPAGTSCDIILGPQGLVFSCPDATGAPNGSMTTLIPGGTTIHAGDPIATFTQQCTINVNPGVQTATVLVSAPGAVLEDNPLVNDPANINKTLSVNIFTPCIQVTKACVNPCTPIGQPIQFSGTVQNCGDVVLTGVTVVDNVAGQVLGPITLNPKGQVGDSATFTGSYTPTGTGAALCGPFTDTVTATGTAPLDSPVTVNNSASATCHIQTNPQITLAKDCFKTGSPGVKTLAPGDTYVVAFTVTNPGNVDLTGVVVNDSVIGTVTVGNLAAGASTTVTSNPITPPANFCGPITDTATATGSQVCPPDATCPSPATVTSAQQTCTITVVCPPQIAITKQIACVTGLDANNNPICGTFGSTATGVKVGNNCPQFCYQIVVSNPGPVGLVNVTVSDPTVGINQTIASLAAGASAPVISATATWCSDTPNTVTAQGNSAVDNSVAGPVSASANAYVVPLNISCVKQVSVDGGAFGTSADIPQDGAAHTVVYQVLVTNPNTAVDVNHPAVDLSVSVSDTACGAIAGSTTVPAGQTVTIPLCTLSLTCPLANPVNTVTVTGTAVQPANGSPLCDIGPNGQPLTVSSTCHATLNCKVQNTGCTPGFWKNCIGQWACFTPTGPNATKVSDVFGAIPSCDGSSLGSSTLLNALSFKGGSTLNGASQILLRAAAAAVLNACNSKLSYPLTQAQIISQVQTALASCDRGTILTLASTLDGFNNLGCNNAQTGASLPCIR